MPPNIPEGYEVLNVPGLPQGFMAPIGAITYTGSVSQGSNTKQFFTLGGKNYSFNSSDKPTGMSDDDFARQIAAIQIPSDVAGPPSPVAPQTPQTTQTTQTTTPMATTTPSPTPASSTYQIKSGDTLSALAQKYGTNIQTLLGLNPQITDPNRIIAGQSLNLPTGQQTSSPAPSLPQASSGNAGIQQQINDIAAKIPAIQAAVSKLTPEQLNDKSAVGSAISDASSAADKANAPPPPVAPDLQTTINNGLQNLQSIADQYNASVANQPSLVDTYNNLLKSQGVTDDKLALVNLQNIMLGTKDDIRKELTAVGAPVTDSGVAYLADLRNQRLITQATQLQNLINVKEDYIDKVVTLTGEDRKAVADRINAQFDFTNKQLTLETDLLKTQATQDLKYQQFIEKQQNDAKARVQAMATTGALGDASNERLQQLAKDSGYTYQDLVDMRGAVKTHDDLKIQNAILLANNRQQQASSAQENAQAIMSGFLAPSQLSYRDRSLALAEIHKQNPNFNIKNSELEYQASLAFTKSVNSQRFANFQFRSQTVLHTIENMRSLSQEIKRSGLAPINKVQLYAASKGVGPQATLAAKYIAQTGLLQEDLANLFMGNASPTDSSLSLAQKVIDSNYNDAQLQAALDTIYDNVQFRSSALDSISSVGGVQESNQTPSSSLDDLRSKYNY